MAKHKLKYQILGYVYLTLVVLAIISVIFYMQDNPFPTVYPTLLPATTYYFSINSVAPSGMICNLSTPH